MEQIVGLLTNPGIVFRIVLCTGFALSAALLMAFAFRKPWAWRGVLGFGLLLPLLTLFIMLTWYAVNVPYWDDYAVLNYLNHPFPSRWGHLFDFHSEHRIAGPRLMFDLVMAFSGGHFNFKVCMVAGNLILLGLALIFFMRFHGLGRLQTL